MGGHQTLTCLSLYWMLDLELQSKPYDHDTGKSCYFSGRCKHWVSGRCVSLKVSTVGVITNCLNRDIVMVLGNELLTDLGGSGEWRILCLYYHKYIILLVGQTGASRTWSVFHISPSCWFAQKPTDIGLAAVEMVFEFILSPPTICFKSNNLPSFVLTLTGHVYHICLVKRTGQYSSMQCSDKNVWPPHFHSKRYYCNIPDITD